MKTAFFNSLAHTLAYELDWLAAVLAARFKLYFGQECAVAKIEDIPAPELSAVPDSYSHIVQHYRLEWAERLMLVLALAPHVRPQALDMFFAHNALYNRVFTEFGGCEGKQHRGFLPTGQTAMFLLAGTDIGSRLAYEASLFSNSPLGTVRLVTLGPAEPSEPVLSGILTLLVDTLALLLAGEPKGGVAERASR